jgi:hypothetical protein
MTPQQKMARYQLGVVMGTIILALALWPFLGRGAMGALGFLGLLGFSPVFFRKRAAGAEPAWDEREQQIHARANLAAFSIFWLYFTGACMIPWAIRFYGHRQATITIDYLPNMLMGGFILLTLAQAIAILAQYRGERGDA